MATSSGKQSYTKIYTNTILVQHSKSTRHKPNRPSVLQRPGGRSSGKRSVIVLGELVQVAHGKRREHKGHMDDHVPHQLGIGDVLRIHEHLEQMNGGDRHNGSRHFHLQRAGIHLAQPAELLGATLILMRRSWGSRFSAIFSFAMILIREMMAL